APRRNDRPQRATQPEPVFHVPGGSDEQRRHRKSTEQWKKRRWAGPTGARSFEDDPEPDGTKGDPAYVFASHGKAGHQPGDDQPPLLCALRPDGKGVYRQKIEIRPAVIDVGDRCVDRERGW